MCCYYRLRRYVGYSSCGLHVLYYNHYFQALSCVKKSLFAYRRLNDLILEESIQVGWPFLRVHRMSSPPMSSPPAPSSSPPSRPVGIARSPRRDELRGAGVSGSPGADASAQAALAAFLNPGGISPPPNIPPRIASFSSGSYNARQGGLSSSPALGSSLGGGVSFPSSHSGTSIPRPPIFLDPGSSASLEGDGPSHSGGSNTPARGRTPLPTDLDALPAEEKARILRRHLVSREERGESQSRRGSSTVDNLARPDLSAAAVHFRSDDSVVEDDAPTPRAGDDDSEFPIPYSTPGGDITYVSNDLFLDRSNSILKFTSRCSHSIYKWQSNAQRGAIKRSRTTSLITRSSNADPRFEHIHEPGGFRRNYLLMRAEEQPGSEPPVMLNNFIDFLYLFGHFVSGAILHFQLMLN